MLAYSSDEERTVIADAATGKTIRVLPNRTIGLALAFSPDSTRLAVIGRDGFLKVWPVSAVKEESDLWRGRVQRGQHPGIAFSADGKLVAATSATLVNVIDSATGETLFSLDRRDIDDGVFQQVAFSPDSRLIVTGSAGLTGAVHVYEVLTRSLVRRYTPGLGGINRLTLLPDGSRAVTAGAEETIIVWDLTLRYGKSAPATADLLSAWGDLDSLDGAKGYAAMRTLIAGGASGLRAIAEGLNSTQENQRKIASWVKELTSEEFTDREAATKALLAEGFPALLAVKDTAARSTSEEARARAADIISRLSGKGYTIPAHGMAGDDLRLTRAVQVLEDIGGAGAIVQLERIAKMAGRDDRAGADARAALKRLKK